MIEIKYSCGCTYSHWGANNIYLIKCCTDHKIEIAKDALRNFNEKEREDRTLMLKKEQIKLIIDGLKMATDVAPELKKIIKTLEGELFD